MGLHKCTGRLGVRHVQAIFLFFGLTIAFGLRVNLSVGIVAMTDNTTNPGIQTVDWSTAERGTVLGSFFWGYLVTQVPAGLLCARVGAIKPLGITMIINGLSTLLLPAAAIYGGFLATCFMRVIQGLGQGFLYPSCFTLMSKWAVPAERGRLISFIFGGGQFGTIIMLVAGGFLAAGAGGWPVIFYVSGGLAILWGVVCLFYMADSPGKHKTITRKEKILIESSLINTAHASDKLKTPWLDIASSVPFWSLLLVHMAQNWGFWTLLTLIPSYFRGVLQFDIKKNGFLSALPYLVMWLISFPLSGLADYLVKKKFLSTGTSRKFWNSVALYGGAVGLGVLSFIKTDEIGAIALLSVTVGLNAATYTGYYLNHLDLSPNFAGTLVGITNDAATICSILGPTVAGLIVTEQDNAGQWRTVFIITAAIYLIGQTAFNIFGSAEVQSWNSIGIANPDSVSLKQSVSQSERNTS